LKTLIKRVDSTLSKGAGIAKHEAKLREKSGATRGSPKKGVTKESVAEQKRVVYKFVPWLPCRSEDRNSKILSRGGEAGKAKKMKWPSICKCGSSEVG